MQSLQIINSMEVVIAELQGDIYSLQGKPSFQGEMDNLKFIEICTNILYQELEYKRILMIGHLIEMMEQIIISPKNEEIFLLYTHINQLKTYYCLLK